MAFLLCKTAIPADVLGRAAATKDIHTLVSCEYTALPCKQDFADKIIRLGTLRWEGYPGLLKWAHPIHMGS